VRKMVPNGCHYDYAIMTTKSGSSEIPRSKKMIESLIRLVVDGREK
jgi:hypothetical protein